ncbi:ABC transporter ATP-binding protein [Kaistia algarum]|uniref:ABC transporter ATP-binding protein n=1 Tax=Kaistia algarum TaxID=2083279 RepID=UPI000CE922F6|nr:ATP-binding cassette domain-containing protein [Kaistia algarum]MCX5514410.1 ATP-binding cassette domain-containing protein [Kaistia algarum]PPE79150.1 ABC transporter ATP-binding protein [Kaistia algarum]
MLLEATGLGKSYGALKVVDDVSIAVDAGDALGIIGPNGAGKSTLFNLIAGSVRPNRGTIRLAGRDITALPAAARCRAGIGRSFQIPRPWVGLTVYENLLVAAEFGAGEAAAMAGSDCLSILDRLGLGHLADVPAGRLRLLERKRLELARGLATRPRVLLLDEIAGGLTDLECESLIEAIRDIRKEGVAIIWIEHVVHALFAVVDRLAVISFGAKIAEGDPREVFASRQVQEIYLGVPA